jgi:hypothetical protein
VSPESASRHFSTTPLKQASCHLLRGEGVESEVQLPYAALHQLLYPALDRVDALPTLQSVALRSAFGLASAPVPDRFLVAVAALTLISDLAADTGAPSSYHLHKVFTKLGLASRAELASAKNLA